MIVQGAVPGDQTTQSLSISSTPRGTTTTSEPKKALRIKLIKLIIHSIDALKR